VELEPHIQELLLATCGRPRHPMVDQWYDRSIGVGVASQISYRPSRYDNELLRRLKAGRRLEQWWHKSVDSNYATDPSSEKIVEAKRQRFTPDGKDERVSRSLAALHQTSRIRLTPEVWRKIIEDVDLEAQSS
jgi:hypothetical protein